MAMTIGQAAEKCGLSIDTLRYYERAGLVPRPIARDGAGRRSYDEDDLAWFGICTSMRRSGMPIAVLRRYVALVRAGEGNEHERLSILERHQGRVRTDLAALQQAQEVIAYKVAYYRERVADGSASGVWVGTAGEEDGAASRQHDEPSRDERGVSSWAGDVPASRPPLVPPDLSGRAPTSASTADPDAAAR